MASGLPSGFTRAEDVAALARTAFGLLRGAPAPAALAAPDLGSLARLLEVNEAWRRRFPGNGQPRCDLAHLCHPADRARLGQALQRALGAREPVTVALRLRAADGRPLPASLSLAAVASRSGPCLLAVHVCDSTEPPARLGLYDELTGLANRTLLHDRMSTALRRAQRRESTVAVVFLDLDDFKSVNDTYGHQVGDELLVSVAHRLSAGLRSSDTAARIGGDEFVLLHEDLGDESEAAAIASRTARALRRPFELSTGVLRVGVSIGVVVADARHSSVVDLLAEADLAMYEAKARGKVWVLFDDARHQRLARTMKLGEELKHAIRRRELRLRYQPVLTADLRRLSGAEALLRWRHPELRLLAPGEFLPAAERSQLMDVIGSWMVNEACDQLRQWDRRHPGTEPQLWVDVSASQLGRRALPQIVDSALERTAIAARRLNFELPAGAVPRLGPDALADLDSLRQRGVRLGVEDFGVHPFSVTDLREQPFQYVKLAERLLTRLADERGAAVVGALVELAHRLELTVVADGVQTPEQADRLTALGADLVQGPVGGRPRTGDALDPDWAG